MKDRERLWPNCRHCVFYLFKASLYVNRLSMQWILVIGCFILFLPTFWFGWHAFGWGLFLIIKLAFCGLSLFAVFAAECWRFILFGVRFVCVFFYFLFAKVASLLSWSFCQSLLFHTLMFLFPLLSIMLLPPVSAMHLGNQEMESDAEDEVNHTLPTICFPLR